MDGPAVTQRFRRLLLVFVIVWSALFGYRAYAAHVAAKDAHNAAQIARVGPALLGAAGADNDIVQTITGFSDLDELEAAERKTSKAFHWSLWLLFGGLIGGCLLITATHWIMYGKWDLRPAKD